MSQRDKLRKTLREYYDNQPYSAGEKEWERASVLVAAARRGRRIRLAVFIFAALIPAIFITIIQFPNPAQKQSRGTITLSDQKMKFDPAPVAVANMTTVFPESTKSAPEAPIKSTLAPHKGSSHASHNLKPAVAHAVFHETHTPQSSSEPVNDHTSSPVPPTPKASQASTVLDEVKASNDNNDLNISPPAITGVTPLASSTTDKGVPEASANPVESVTSATSKIKNSQGDEKTIEEKDKQQGTVDILPQKAGTITLNNVEEEIRINENSKNLPVLVVQDAFIDTSRNAISVDTAAGKKIVGGDTLPASALLRQMAGEGIFYEAGAAWFYGWKEPAKRDASGFSPVAGINYMNRLTDRCAISFGVQYIQVRNLSASSKTSRESIYRYGEQSRVTVITPSVIHYLVAPLRFHYYLDEKNCVGGGINLAYLLSVDAKVTSYDEKPGSRENFQTTKLSGYTEGFSWFDSQLALFYRRNMCPSLALQAEIFFGIKDVKQDNFFGTISKERNSGAKLTLVYYAFRKKWK